MKFTKACDYALRMMVYLSTSGEDETISIRELSERIDIPRSFLGNIVQKLSNASILETVKGAKGGLRLLKNPDQITAFDMIHTIENDFTINTYQKDCDCTHETHCDVHPLIKHLQKFMVNKNPAECVPPACIILFYYGLSSINFIDNHYYVSD